jgi:hypothetical protein
MNFLMAFWTSLMIAIRARLFFLHPLPQVCLLRTLPPPAPHPVAVTLPLLLASPSVRAKSAQLFTMGTATNVAAAASPHVPTPLPYLANENPTTPALPTHARQPSLDLSEAQRRRMEHNKLQARSKKKPRIHQPPSLVGPSASSSNANPDSNLPNGPPLLIPVRTLTCTIPFDCHQCHSLALEQSFP